MKWQKILNNINQENIDLGLDRIRKVYKILSINLKYQPYIITVGGTNGKGSTCAFLNSILVAHNYKVGLFSSPHLFKFNERIKVNNKSITNTALDRVFNIIEAARKDSKVNLTYFEIASLAAWIYFAFEECQFVILEVGLGGRLDATNLWNSNIAIITTIAKDHQAYLGDTIEEIVTEKVEIARKNKILIYGDRTLPKSLVKKAKQIGTNLKLLSRDFAYYKNSKSWDLWIQEKQKHLKFTRLPNPKNTSYIQYQNSTAAICSLYYLNLQGICNLDVNKIKSGILKTNLTCRFEVIKISKKRKIIFDVCHNPQAATVLANNLRELSKEDTTKFHAIFATLKDKDISGIINPLIDSFSNWYLANLPQSQRGANNNEIFIIFQRKYQHKISDKKITIFKNPTSAFYEAMDITSMGDIIVVFGSFITVSECYPLINQV